MPAFLRLSLAAALAGKIKDTLGQAIVVENRPAAGGTPEAFAKLMTDEAVKWAPIIKRTGAKLD